VTRTGARGGAAGVVLAVVALLVGMPTPAFADNVRDSQWHLQFLDVAAAHRYSEGAGVLVAVVDSGVDASHPDLLGNVVAGTETYAGSKGGDGRTDAYGHGTEMAGLIAAHGDGNHNANGALGIAPRATILPVRTGVGGGIATAVAAGVSWATAHGAKVISISAGGAPSADDQRAIEEAIAHDIVVVAAAGNTPEATGVEYPAAYPGVLAVGGVDQNGNHAAVSVTGSEVVLSAPAVDITSTALNHKYSTATGTSPATAIVAGAAALVRARFPNLSAAEVIHRLTATATDKGPKGRDDQYGYGIVNLVAALTADVPPLPASPSPSPLVTASPGKTGNTPWAGLILVLAVLVVLAIVGFLVARRRRSSG
jgi:type VII secretion-associated serine protease mycosin